jgi:mRNA-degrading endonuclease RelE of RelBE toxin-antitoxin system
VFTIFIERRAREYVKRLPPKTRRIIVEKILELKEDPFPGGNKEKLEYPRPPAVYRLHIGRSFTVFYIIEHEESVVKIEKVMTIEKAHKEYSRR